MSSAPIVRHAPPYWSFSGFWEGVRVTLPILPSVFVFGAGFGANAAQKGLSFIEAVLMSALVCAGASQFVAMEVWPDGMTLAALVTVTLVTTTVNLRMVLMSASLRPWFGVMPPWQIYPALFFCSDSTWLLASRYRAEGGSDVAMFLGVGVVTWVVWVAASLIGYLVGALIADPTRYGIDLILPVFFVVMLIPLWRGARAAIPWLVAGAVALVASWVIPGWWFIIVGALAGSITGGFLDEPA